MSSFKRGDWNCSNCTKHNFAKRTSCFGCGQSKSTSSSGRRHRGTVECYDCHQQVADLKRHRQSCPKSRKAKSALAPQVQPGFLENLVNQIGSVANMLSGNSETTTTTTTTTTRITSATNTKDVSKTVDFYSLLDVSGSMSGGRLEQAKEVLTELFNHMDEHDRISIVSFDSKAFFKLKPRPVGQIRRQDELSGVLGRIFAQGLTAIWDAIHLAVTQIRDKSKKTVLIVLTDGQDNSSSHTYDDVLQLVDQYPSISLSIIHIDGSGKIDPQYQELCEKNHGDYVIIEETQIKIEMTRVFKKYYHQN